MDDILHFFTAASAAVCVKLVSSVDDILWLSAFLTPNFSSETRVRNASVYAGVCLLQTCLAFLISTGGETALDKLTDKYFGDHELSGDKLITIISGTTLGVYAIVLWTIYYKEEIIGTNDGEGRDDIEYNSVSNEINHTVEEKENNWTIEMSKCKAAHTKPDPEPDTDSCCSRSSEEIESDIKSKTADSDIETIDPRKENAEPWSSSLFAIAFLGSLDDLTLFVPLLAGKTFHFFELVAGAMIAVLMILSLCFCLVRCKFLADIIQRIPVCAIVFIFSIVLLVKGIVMV